MESGAFFQYPGFLGEKSLFPGEKWAFLGEKVHRAEKRTEEQRTAENSTVEQTRAEKKRVDITAEQNKIENGEWKMTD